MRLEQKLVLVPAPSEVATDLAEYGELSHRSRLICGNAACEATEIVPYSDPALRLTEVVVDVLHWFIDETNGKWDDASNALESALVKAQQDLTERWPVS